MRRRQRYRSAAAIMLLLFPALVAAQGTSLTITSLDTSRFPEISMRVYTHLPGRRASTLDRRNMAVFENGIAQPVTLYSCPGDSSIRLSIAILLDRSSSMIKSPDGSLDPDSSTLRAAKHAISSFFAEMDEPDEAALFSFTTTEFQRSHVFTVEQDFTHDVGLLQNSLVPVSAGGGTRLWQALIDAVSFVEARNGRRLILLVTDGRNTLGESYRDLAYERLRDTGIPVYAVGLGPNPDRYELQALTGSTGGRYHAAPDAAALDSTFTLLAGDLLHEDCVLRYTSSDGCRDGTERHVELRLVGAGGYAETDTSYTVDTRLMHVTLGVADGREVEGGSPVILPVSVPGFFSMSQMLSYDLEFSYDATLMRFDSVSAAGAVSEGTVLLAGEPDPGRLRIEADPHIPFLPTGTLFFLHFSTRKRQSDTLAEVSVAGARLEQECPVLLDAYGGVLRILACRRAYRVGSGVHIVSSGDHALAVPLRINPPLDTGDEVVLTCSLHVDSLLEYAGYDASGGSMPGAAVQVLARGRDIECMIGGRVAREDSTILVLYFRAGESASTRRTALRLLDVTLESACRSELHPVDTRITLEGFCQPLVRRRAPVSLGVHPNPAAGPVSITVGGHADRLRMLVVFDAWGRAVVRRDLGSAPWVEGALSLDTAGWVTGMYTVVLYGGGEVASARLLHFR
jgi:hypothetical protein